MVPSVRHKYFMKTPIAILNDEYDDYISIDYMVTNQCNFSCHYCHPGSNEGDLKFPKDYQLLLDNFSHLLTIYKTHFNKKRIKFEITGGEPTLWPKLSHFTKWLKDEHNVTNVIIPSNGSRTLRWWQENGHVFDEVHLSLHHEEGDADHMIKVADHLYHNTDAHVAINVLMDPTAWDKCKENLDKVLKHPTPWLVKTWVLVEDGHIRDDYTAEQLNMFRDKVQKKPPQWYIDKMIARGIIPKETTAHVKFDDDTIDLYNSFTLRENRLHNFYGWSCNLGVDRLAILGGVLMGSCGATNLFNLNEPLKIDDPLFKDKFTSELIKPLTCDQFSCGSCTKDLKIPKEKINDVRVIPIIRQ